MRGQHVHIVANLGDRSTDPNFVQNARALR